MLIYLLCKVSDIHEIHASSSSFILTQKSPESASVILVQIKNTGETERLYKREKQTMFTASSRTLLITVFKISHSYILCLGASPEDLTADLAAVLQNLLSFMAQTDTIANVLRGENLSVF